MSIKLIIILICLNITISQSDDLILNEFSQNYIDINRINKSNIDCYFEDNLSKKEFSYQIYLVSYEEDESGLTVQVTDNEEYVYVTSSVKLKKMTHKTLTNKKLSITIKYGYSAKISIMIESTERNYEIILPGIIGVTKKNYSCFNIPDNKKNYVIQFVHNNKDEEIFYENNYYNIPFFIFPNNKTVIPCNEDLIFNIAPFVIKDYFGYYYIISSNSGITYHFNSIFENNDLKEKKEFVLQNGINKIKLPNNNYHKNIVLKFFTQIKDNDNLYITLLIDNKRVLNETKTCNKKEKCFMNIGFSYPGNNNYIEIENHNNITFKYEFTNNTDPKYYPTDLSSFQIFLIVLLILIIIAAIGGGVYWFINDKMKNPTFETFNFKDKEVKEMQQGLTKV